MHSNSPYIPSAAASPPGPPSSQSSSVGSCYTSESSQASSLRARPTLSDPSSSSTSPASTYERSTDQPYAFAHLKRSTSSSAPSARQPSSAIHASLESHFNPAPASSTGHSPLAPRHSPREAIAMRPPLSGAVEANELHSYRRAPPIIASPSNSFTSDPRYHTSLSKEVQHSVSPDNHHGPLSKARRTSPGGSRASGNLVATQQGSTDSAHASESNPLSSSSRSTQSSRGAEAESQTSSTSAATQHTGAWSNVASTAPSRGVGVGVGADSQSRWPFSDSSQQGQASKNARAATSSTMLSPRTRVDDGRQADSNAAPSRRTPSPRQAAVAPDQTSSGGPLSNFSDGLNRSKPPTLPKMDLATFAPQELLKILATLLHEIATANDEFQPDGSKDASSASGSRRGARSRDRSAPATPADDSSARRDYSTPPGSHLSFTDARRPSVTTAALGALATPSSTLCFHARNVPSISIESYLLRILKYCPTTNEVFLSLLVYFDRMSRMGTGAKPGANGEGEVAGEAAGLPRAVERATGGHHDLAGDSGSLSDGGGVSSAKETQPYTHPGIRGFAIDSYNVHRLVIAGVTVASKFFSDVFYTNSRYAKVGGLPPHELNQLELQFLLLNDFRLTIPLEEMQRYADQLLMYASGRPDMAQLTKQVSPAVTPGNPSVSASGTVSDANSATPVAAKAEHEEASAAATASMGTVSMQTARTGRSDVDAEGDVQMSDTRG